MKKFLVIVIILMVFLSGCGKQKPAPDSAQPTPETAASTTTTTYTNSALGYTIAYPVNWVVNEFVSDSRNNDISIHPTNPDVLPTFPTSTADYIHIRLENLTLPQMRKINSTQVAGSNMVESQISFAGQIAYLYSQQDYPNPGETKPLIVFRKILLEHNGQVISIFTHKYQLAEVTKALESFMFISSLGAPTTTENIVNIPELSIKLSLPAGYTIGTDVNNGIDGNFGSYSFDIHEKQDTQPTLQRLSFYSAESIDKFTKTKCADTSDWEGNPCANGGYPGLNKFVAEKNAFEKKLDKFDSGNLKQFNDRNFYSYKFRCSGDSCLIYKYTTYLGDKKVDFTIISWEIDGKKSADNLFGMVRLW